MTKSQLHVEQNMSPVPSIISWTNNEIELWKNVSLNFKYVYLCFFLYLPCLDQTEAQRAEKIFLETPLPPPPLSQGLDPALLLFIPSFNVLRSYFDVSHTLVAVLTV